MVGRKVRKVTLKLSPELLEKWGGASQTPTYPRKKQQKVRAAASSAAGTTGDGTPQRTGTPLEESEEATKSMVTDGSKLSSNIRVGVSGLTMNANTVRAVDRSKRKVSSWDKCDVIQPNSSELANVKDDDIENDDYQGKLIISRSGKAVSMRDIGGFEQHPDGETQSQLLKECKEQGKRVIRSFSGYYMLLPAWHKTKEGELNMPLPSESVESVKPETGVEPKVKTES